MTARLSRRRFLAQSIAASAVTPVVMSVEEHRLLARPAEPAALDAPVAASDRWMGAIKHVKMSRLICGGNLISGYAHSRDLIYVSDLLKHYYTDEKIMDMWALCEQHGVNTMVAYPGDPHAIEVYRRHRARGGKIQYLAQIDPDPADLKQAVTSAVDAGAVGAFLVGNTGDKWSRAKAVGRIAEVVGLIKDAGLIAGVAGHELRTPQVCESGSVDPDFYVKTLHDQSYWSKQQSGQEMDVIDNYGDRQLLVQGPGQGDRVHGGGRASPGSRTRCWRPAPSRRSTASATPSRTAPTSPRSGCSTSRSPRTWPSRTGRWPTRSNRARAWMA